MTIREADLPKYQELLEEKKEAYSKQLTGLRKKIDPVIIQCGDIFRLTVADQVQQRSLAVHPLAIHRSDDVVAVLAGVAVGDVTLDAALQGRAVGVDRSPQRP